MPPPPRGRAGAWTTSWRGCASRGNAATRTDRPVRWTSRAVSALRADLLPVEGHASGLPWADQVRWTVLARVGTERRLRIRRERDQRIVRVDLHGLDGDGARLACAILKQALLANDHPLRYVRVVVGKGRRSAQGRRVLAGIAADVLTPHHPLSVRTSTSDAPDGYLDVWHRDRWPRPRLTAGRR